MRRTRCIVCYTGAVIDVSVTPAANRAKATVDDLVRQLQEQESLLKGAPIRVDVITDGSGTFGPARGLAPDDELPSATDPASLFLVFGAKYVDRFPRSKIDSAALVTEHHVRQVLAYNCMLSPADHHLKTSASEHARADACAKAIAADFQERVAALPAAMEALAAVRLVSDPETTLAARVGDLTGLVDSGSAELAHSREGLAKAKAKLDAVQQRFDDTRAVAPPAAGAASQQNIDLMARAIEARVEDLKALLKATERVRLEVGKLLQGVKAVRDGVLLKMTMVASLPEAYAAAIALARRRLTFNKAAGRLRQMLAVEHGAICDETALFVAHFGSRFPTNIVPGIAMKPPLPTFDDPVADVMRPHMCDLEEDPVSELLAKLGLTRERALRPAPSAVPPAEPSSAAAVAAAEEQKARDHEHAAEVAAMQGQLDALQRELAAALASRQQDRDEIRMAQTRATDAEADASRSRQERQMFAESRDILQKKVDTLIADNAALDEAFAQATAARERAPADETAAQTERDRAEALAAQVEALQTSLEAADTAARAREAEKAELQETLTRMAARISEQSEDLTAAAESAQTSSEVAARAVAAEHAGQLRLCAASEAVGRGDTCAEGLLGGMDLHARLQSELLRTAVAAATQPAVAWGRPVGGSSGALDGDEAASAGALSSSSASFGRPIRLSPATLVNLEAAHMGKGGVIDRDALHLAVYEELQFVGRPLKFFPTTHKAEGLWGSEKVYLDAKRAGFTIRAVCPTTTVQSIGDRARATVGFVFGELVFVANVQRFEDGTVIVSGPVRFHTAPVAADE